MSATTTSRYGWQALYATYDDISCGSGAVAPPGGTGEASRVFGAASAPRLAAEADRARGEHRNRDHRRHRQPRRNRQADDRRDDRDADVDQEHVGSHRERLLLAEFTRDPRPASFKRLPPVGFGAQVRVASYAPPGDGNQQAEVPPQLRSSLLATFNSGFKLEDSGGGFFSQGHVYAPLIYGQATLIGYADGAVDVTTWTGGPTPGPGIAFARQNLPLVVLEDGRLNPAPSRTIRCGEPRSATQSACGARGSASMPTAT